MSALARDTCPKDEIWDDEITQSQQDDRLMARQARAIELEERRPKTDIHPEPTFQWDTDACNYHRNSAGHWVVIGPVELVNEGAVDVRTKAGKMKTEQVLGVGEPFDFRGMQYRYGYIAARSEQRHVRTKARGSYRSQEDAADSYARQYGR